MFRMSVAHKAESLYEIDERDKLRSFLKDAIRIDQSNIRLASLSAFVSNQYEEKDLYPFCVDPMSWITTYNIKSHITNFEEFRLKLIDYLNRIPNVWEPSNATTKKGYQTEDQLFDLQDDLLNELEKIVRLKIDEYYEEYKVRSSVFISRWPAVKKMKSWYVRLIQGGYQDAHMHSLGWLSGVVYLNTIEHPTMVRDQLSLVFTDITIEFLTVIFRRNSINPLMEILCYSLQVYFIELFQFSRILRET